MDERGRKRTSMWDLEDNEREHVRGGEYRASSKEYKSYSGRHSSTYAADDNPKYPTEVRSKYEPDASTRDRATEKRGTWRNSSLDRENIDFSEAGSKWSEDGNRRDYVRSPKSSWQRPNRSSSRGRSRSRSRSPVRDYRHGSSMSDRPITRPEVPIQTCRDFTSGRCRRGSHCPFLHPSSQNYEDRRYDNKHRDESNRRGNYSHYNATDGQYNDIKGDGLDSKRETDRNSRGLSFNHGVEREPRSSDIRCTFFAAGYCRNGKYCRFIHDIQTSSTSGERALGESWKKTHGFEKVDQVDSSSKFTDTVDPRDERCRKEYSSDRRGHVARDTKLCDAVDLHEDKWRKNCSPEKMGQVDQGKKFSASENGKEGTSRENRSPVKDGQSDRDVAFNGSSDPHGKESQSKVVSSSMRHRWDKETEVDPKTTDKFVTVEANQTMEWKSDNHANNNGNPELKSVVDWIGDKMSPEWNPKVASAMTVAQDEPAYAIQTPGSFRHSMPSNQEPQYKLNVPSETPNVVEVKSQQSFNPASDTRGAFSYDQNVSSHVPANIQSSFFSGNSSQLGTHGIKICAPENLNSGAQGQHFCASHFSGNPVNADNDISSVKPKCEDPAASEAAFGATLATSGARQEQFGHLTNLSASLAHLLDKGQQLPQIYSAVKPPNAVPSIEASNMIVSQFPAATVQPHPPIGFTEPYVNAGERQPNSFTTLYAPYPGVVNTNDDVKQETPLVDLYNNGGTVGNLGPKPDVGSNVNTNSQTIPIEIAKGKDKQDNSREGSPLENMGVEGKVDAGKKVKEVKAVREFKHALVNFVKELLKPAWKDGQIDKDGFKTIVKKVVDKVTGTIQEINIPQTPEKVEHYLSASKPKLTKLVQAYVDRNPKKQA